MDLKVWYVPVDTERDGLALSLDEGGTGIGQVLAIIYAAMSYDNFVIGIDEPGSHLHPGALKKLMGILSLYGTNQYIIATHDPEVISHPSVQNLIEVKWSSGESKARVIDKSTLSEVKALLLSIGVSLADTFGAVNIVWVEGQTEEICFPYIRASCYPLDRSPITYLAVRSTAGLTNKKTAAESLEIYERLSAGGALLAPTLAFSLDRELRSDSEVADLERRKTRTRILPRRCLENYVLNAAAVLAVLSEEGEAPELALTQICIENEIRKARPRKDLRYGSDDGMSDTDGAVVLDKVFGELTAAKVAFRKTVHTPRLIRWLLENEPAEVAELIDYVGKLHITA